MKNRRLPCLFIFAMIFLAGCGSSKISFREEMERQKAWEQGSTASPSPIESSDNARTQERRAIKERIGSLVKDGPSSEVFSNEDADAIIDAPLGAFDALHNRCFDVAVPVSSVSIIVGIFLFIFCRGNKGLRNLGLFGLVFTIPMVMIFLTVGVSWLQHIFGR